MPRPHQKNRVAEFALWRLRRFGAFVGQSDSERIWQPSQKIQETAEGGLSWDELGRVRVCGPASLWKRVAGRLKTALSGATA